ncbi:MAG: M24 family metallopeptidase [Anaerolineae bacterium]
MNRSGWMIELPVLFALQKEGIKVVDGQKLMQDARVIKTQDEITLLNTACMMVDAAYDELYRFLRPGVRENECVGLTSKVLYDIGSEHVEGINAISGERCSPHPHVFSDRYLRPGDPAYFDILHAYMGYRTCYYRTFAVGSASPALVDAYKRCRYYLDVQLSRPSSLAPPPPILPSSGPKPKSLASPTKKRLLPCNMGMAWAYPFGNSRSFSRLVSLDHPR